MRKASSDPAAASSGRRRGVAAQSLLGPPPPRGVQACPHRPACTACPRFGQAGIAPAAARALAELAHAHGLPDVGLVAGARAAFRLRARLAIRGRVNSPRIGLFELGSHRVIHVPNCRIQHPLINHVASTVRRALADASVTCYSERAHAGIARYLQVVVERSSQRAQVVLVANAASAAPLAQAFALIRERLGQALHSLWFSANSSQANAILGAQIEHILGPQTVVERFGGARVHYPPGAFGQSNLDMAERLIAHVRELVPDGARVAEFHAGVGAIGLSILDRAAEIRLNEVNPHALRGLALGLEELPPAQRAKIAVVPGEAAAALEAAEGVDLVILDPPRRGLDAGLMERLRDRPPPRVVYVSCAASSLLEDTARLTAGRLRLAGLAAFDLMPYTGHVESVAVLERR